MVQEDAYLAIITTGVAESVLNFDLVTRRGTSEHIISHCNAETALQLNLMVVVHTVSPALATIDGKACILSEPIIYSIAPDEVGHGRLSGRAELILGSFGGLEK